MNPFRDTIVASAWNTTPADISEIHHSVYEECLQGLEHVRSSRRSAALLIHGEAGSGKTHLLSRLRARLTPRAPIATDRAESLFVWVRLQTSPRMIWRTLRRIIVEDWFRPVEDGRPQIDRILFHRLAALRPAEWDLEPWYEYMLDEKPEDLLNLVEQICQDLHLDHNLSVAFRHIAFGEHRRELRAWLAGTSLPDSVLDRLELAREEGTEEELEEHAKQLVLMLCRLTGPDLPILLSFDQVEALQLRPDETDALFIFGQLVSALHDGTSNVLMISSVQSAFENQLSTYARDADYDRMVSLGKLSLSPLTRQQAFKVIDARLQAAGCPRPEGKEDLASWPLDAEEFESLFDKGAISPRKLLSRCAERFLSAGRGEPAVERKTETTAADMGAFLQEQLEGEIEQRVASNAPERVEEIIQHGLPLVVNLISPATQMRHDHLLPDVPLIFETPRGNVGLSVCVQANMGSLAGRFRRLKSQMGLQRVKRLVLIRDQRVPITAGSKKAKEYLQELEDQNATTLFPGVEAIAALDALRSLLSDAQSGDLSFNGESISPQTVGEWLRHHLPRSLQELSEVVLGGLSDSKAGTDPMSADRELLSALLHAEPIVSVQHAAQHLGKGSDQVEEIARRYPDQFGVLGNPADTIFRREVAAEEESSAVAES